MKLVEYEYFMVEKRTSKTKHIILFYLIFTYMYKEFIYLQSIIKHLSLLYLQIDILFYEKWGLISVDELELRIIILIS
jgi:hypothetical protein